MLMHNSDGLDAIRSKAKHLAYQDRFNPFARRPSDRKLSTRNRDIESAPSVPRDGDDRAAIGSQVLGQEKDEDHGRDNGIRNQDVVVSAPQRESNNAEKSARSRSTKTGRVAGSKSDENILPHWTSPIERSNTSDPSGEDSERTLNESGDARLNASGTSNGKPGRRRRLKALFLKKSENLDDTPASDSKPPKQKFTLWGQLRATLFSSPINILLFAAPVGIALNYTGVNKVIVFVVNFIAIIPLAGMLSYATEEIAMRVGETLGGLLNATFGNAVELIVSILALVNGQILIVQTSLIGSMLSNLLLVLGMCFSVGGYNRIEQHFNVTVAQTAASLLALSVGSLIIPTAFAQWGNASDPASVAPISRGTAIILLVVYGLYLFFQLKSHVGMYNAKSEKVPKRWSKLEDGAVQRGIATMGAGTAASMGGGVNQANLIQKRAGEGDDDDEETPQLSLAGALVTLAGSTAMVALCAEYMVSSINALTATGHISEEFVGLILLPIVGNAAEHATAVTVAAKDKMDLAIGVAVGSSMQIALLVLPLSVVLGWIIGTTPAMTLNFDGFQIALLFVAVLLVNYLIQDGKSHWLEGVLLMATYLLIALAAWFYPATGVSG